jgi:hypothetical protein
VLVGRIRKFIPNYLVVAFMPNHLVILSEAKDLWYLIQRCIGIGGFLFMKRLLFILCMLAVPSLSQQIKNPVTSVVKDILTRQHRNLVEAAEEMPADKFSFKPTPLQEPFGHLVLHIREANYLFCSKAGDVSAPKTEELKDTDPKDKLVDALKASFDFCETSLGKADDSKLGDTIEGFGGHQQPRAWAWIAAVANWADHYAAAAMYLRLNGLLPPTAQPKK